MIARKKSRKDRQLQFSDRQLTCLTEKVNNANKRAELSRNDLFCWHQPSFLHFFLMPFVLPFRQF